MGFVYDWRDPYAVSGRGLTRRRRIRQERGERESLSKTTEGGMSAMESQSACSAGSPNDLARVDGVL